MRMHLKDRRLRSSSGHRTKVSTCALLLVCLATASLAQGTVTITFESQMSVGHYAESGVSFWNPYGPEVPSVLPSGHAGYPDNGSQYLSSGGVDLLTFGFNTTPTTYFDLISLDIAETTPGPITLQVVGYPAMSAPVTNTITTDGIMDGPGGQADFQTFYFGSTFQHVNRVQITTDQWYLDNVVLAGVPEPSIAGLSLLAALCALVARGILRHRVSKSSNP
jgi:hypothetical protein